MDEADLLGDRIAIMADGALQCVGSSLSPVYKCFHRLLSAQMFFFSLVSGIGWLLLYGKVESLSVRPSPAEACYQGGEQCADAAAGEH